MYCQECNQKPARVSIIQIVDGEKTELHLCEDCAEKHNFSLMDLVGNLTEPNFLGSIFNISTFEKKDQELGKVVICPQCGLMFADIVKSGKLGCVECYKTFTAELDPSLRKLQGHTRHIGKIPLRNGEKIRRQRELDKLKSDLQAAIAAEAYEKAAEIRDAIKAEEESI